jgi:hypothetical protein
MGSQSVCAHHEPEAQSLLWRIEEAMENFLLVSELAGMLSQRVRMSPKARSRKTNRSFYLVI